MGLGFTWIPKVCKIMAFMAVIMGLGLLFYILLGSRYRFPQFKAYSGLKGFGKLGLQVPGLCLRRIEGGLGSGLTLRVQGPK